MKFINAERNHFGVEPICRTLEIAPSTYYSAISRPCSERQRRDAERVGRLMRALQLEGVRRGKGKRTTLAAELPSRI